MVGREVMLSLAVAPAQPRKAVALEASELELVGTAAGGRSRLSKVSLQVRQGEIVGIAGL